MRFRTRTQEVEAIQYTGDNAAEVMRFCDTASAHSDGKGFEWIQVLTSDNERVSVYAGEYIRKAEGGWVVQLREFFEAPADRGVSARPVAPPAAFDHRAVHCASLSFAAP